MTWTTPTNVSAGEADSGKFNTETVANLLHIHDTLLDGLQIQAGTFDTVFSGVEQQNSATISYPSAFASAPLIVCTVRTVTGKEMVVNIGSVTSSGFVARIGTADDATISTTVTCNYIAIGTPA